MLGIGCGATGNGLIGILDSAAGIAWETSGLLSGLLPTATEEAELSDVETGDRGDQRFPGFQQFLKTIQ